MTKNIQDLISEELKSANSLSDTSIHRIEEDILQRYKIDVIEGPDQGKSFYLINKKTIVGRGSVGIPLRDIDVSRLHAAFEVQENGQVLIRDLGSTNGTFVNDVRVADITLKSSDKIHMGTTKMIFNIEKVSEHVGER